MVSSETKELAPPSRGTGDSRSPVPVGRGPLTLRVLRLILVAALGLVVALHWGSIYLVNVQTMLASMRAGTDLNTLILLAAVYAVALALPYVPGMELGLMLMVAFGPRGVLPVYAATLFGLSLSYAVGRLMASRLTWPRSWDPPPTTPAQGADHPLQGLLSKNRWARYLPIRLILWLATHRYLALAICLNVPGNSVIGGGGGIALLCGLSGQYSYTRFLATVALAVSPVPLLVLLGAPGVDITLPGVPQLSEVLNWLNLP